MRLAVILVHYHTPGLAADAVEALRAHLNGSGIEAEWLLVDNGSDPAGRAVLESLPVQRIDPGTNLGYAGGVNLGMARSTAEAAVVLNPDVLVLPGCVPILLDALRSGAAVAGPAFFWDQDRRMLLPPAEVRDRRGELAAVLASRGEPWARRARHRWRRHARLHWQARSPLPSYSLSGSLLAIRRDAWERVGPFDEGYRLYFEETDWLRRAERLGLPALYIPAAEAVHLHGRSTAGEPRSRQWFEESARRFRERYYGAAFARLLEALDRRLPRKEPAGVAPLPVDGLDLSAYPFPLWIEVSPSPAGFPAAAERLEARPADGRWRLPQEIAERIGSGAGWFVRFADENGVEL